MASIDASTSGAGGVITTADNTGTLQLKSAGTTVSTINAYGIGLGTGVPSSGIGITFPATQSASSDANTLDDYEEGTWTPNLVANSGSITAQTTSGSYLKVGKLVTVNIKITSITVGASTTLYINNLPFTASTFQSQGLAREDKATGLFWSFNADTSSTSAYLFRYDNSNVVSSSLGWNGSVTYISAS